MPPPLTAAAMPFATGDAVWWAAVAVISVGGVAHLASMLLTRWGDQAPSAKALAFSLLAHLWLFCGSYASAPLLSRIVPDEDRLDPEPIRIGRIVPDGEDPLPRSDDGLPAWERSTEDTPEIETSRDDLDREPPTPAELAREATPAEPLLATGELPEQVDPADPLEDPAAELTRTETPTIDNAADLPEVEDTASLRTVPGDVATTRTSRPDDGPAGDPAEVARTAAPRSRLSGTTAITDRGPDPSSPEPEPVVRRGPPDESVVRREVAPAAIAYGVSADPPPRRRPTTDTPAVRRSRPTTERDRESLTAIRRSRPRISPLEDPALRRSRSPNQRLRDWQPGVVTTPGLPVIAPSVTGLSRTPTNRYRTRAPPRGGALARARGGTAESEAAVEAALAWLARQQHPDGYWDADEYGAGTVRIDEDGIDRQNSGKRADSGLTALAVLAFLGAGYTSEAGDYAGTVGRAVDWLVANQAEDGYLGVAAVSYEAMYCHGMATFALGEAYAMRQAGTADARSEALRRALGRAVAYIVERQGEDGGWRYAPGQNGDMSMFGWQLMALKSAAIAGVSVPASARAKMREFLDSRAAGEHGGLAAYLYNLDPSHPMTAEALYCRQMLETDLEPERVAEAVAFLNTNPPRRSALDLYYWYYGTLAMFQIGGDPWERWNESVRETLIAEQVAEGENAGSWNPRGPWGPYGGRLYSTAMATLSLEVYYRFLPLYRSK